MIITLPYPSKSPSLSINVKFPSLPFNIIGLVAFLIFVMMFLFLNMPTVDSVSHRIHIRFITDSLLADSVVAIVVNVVAVTIFVCSAGFCSVGQLLL